MIKTIRIGIYPVEKKTFLIIPLYLLSQLDCIFAGCHKVSDYTDHFLSQ